MKCKIIIYNNLDILAQNQGNIIYQLNLLIFLMVILKINNLQKKFNLIFDFIYFYFIPILVI